MPKPLRLLPKPAGDKFVNLVLAATASLVAAPLIATVASAFAPRVESARAELLFGGYAELLLDTATTSLALAVGVCALAALWGTVGAWLVTAYEFPGRRLLEALLVLPIAVPPYVSGFAYVGFFDYSGVVQRLFREVLGLPPGAYPVIDVMTPVGAAFILSLSLCPYIYLAVRASFRSNPLTESARALGASSLKSFWTVAFPLARPSLIAGGSLVAMEVLADYGLVSYFGVNTFSTAIFRTWFGTGDIVLALRLALGLLVLVLAARAVERGVLRRDIFAVTARLSRRSDAGARTGRLAPALFVTACVPVVFGVGLPLFQLGYWMVRHSSSVIPPDFGPALLGSLFLGVAATAVIGAVAIVTGFLISQKPVSSPWARLSGIFSIGYAAPGAVLAVSLLASFAAVDSAAGVFGSVSKPILTGSFTGLVLAYTVRYLAVAYEPILAGFSKTSRSYHEASRALGRGRLATLVAVDLPIVRPTILSGLLLLFIDVLRELPMTIILRPFGFETLATKAVEYAADERLYQTAAPALVLTALGAVAVVVLFRKEGHDVHNPSSA